jgi:hypothetical protein
MTSASRVEPSERSDRAGRTTSGKKVPGDQSSGRLAVGAGDPDQLDVFSGISVHHRRQMGGRSS